MSALSELQPLNIMYTLGHEDVNDFESLLGFPRIFGKVRSKSKRASTFLPYPSDCNSEEKKAGGEVSSRCRSIESKGREIASVFKKCGSAIGSGESKPSRESRPNLKHLPVIVAE